MKKFSLYFLISLQTFLIVFFILSFNHLSKLNKIEEEYQNSFVDYNEKVKQEENNKTMLNEEINKLNNELNEKEELNKNLNSIVDMNKMHKQELEKRVNK